MEKIIFNEILDFIIEERGNYKQKITGNTLLEKDLGISGDDGEDFMYSFFIKFNINYDNFDISNYFHREGFDFILASVNLIFGKRIKQPVYDIKISDLKNAIEQGVWIPPC